MTWRQRQERSSREPRDASGTPRSFERQRTGFPECTDLAKSSISGSSAPEPWENEFLLSRMVRTVRCVGSLRLGPRPHGLKNGYTMRRHLVVKGCRVRNSVFKVVCLRELTATSVSPP